MDPLLAAFFALSPEELQQTLRYQMLARRESYYEGKQYAGRPLTAEGYYKGNPEMYGSLTGTPPWSRRDPGAVWNLTAIVVKEITDWTLGGKAWPIIKVKDDEAATAWLVAVAEASALPLVAKGARNRGGATGTAIMSFTVREGRFVFETHRPENCWPLSWRDPASHRPAQVVKVYQGDNPLAKTEADLPWVARVWDEQDEATYAREKDVATGKWSWRETGRVTHGLGFCPVYWYPQGAEDGRHDGVHDIDTAEGEIDEANELWASAGCTTKRNADDTLVIHEDSRLNPGNIKKGANNVIWAKDGAEYLTQDGASARVCVELAGERGEHVFQRAGIMIANADQMGKATSGEALKRLFQKTLNTSGDHQTGYGRGLLIPLLQGVLAAGRMLKKQGRPAVLPPREQKRDATLGATVVTPYDPGAGDIIELTWPPPFQPTIDDIGKQITAATGATGGKQVLSRETVVRWLASSPLPITNADEEMRAIEEDEAASAERQAASFGLGAPPKGAAGAVRGKEPPAEGEDDDQAEPPAEGERPAA